MLFVTSSLNDVCTNIEWDRNSSIFEIDKYRRKEEHVWSLCERLHADTAEIDGMCEGVLSYRASGVACKSSPTSSGVRRCQGFPELSLTA